MSMTCSSTLVEPASVTPSSCVCDKWVHSMLVRMSDCNINCLCFSTAWRIQERAKWSMYWIMKPETADWSWGVCCLRMALETTWWRSRGQRCTWEYKLIPSESELDFNAGFTTHTITFKCIGTIKDTGHQDALRTAVGSLKEDKDVSVRLRMTWTGKPSWCKCYCLRLSGWQWWNVLHMLFRTH